MTEAQTRILAMPDGRDLEVWLAGPTDGVPLVDHHGTPSCGRPPAHLVAAVERHGIRLIAPTRPGYGASADLAGRSVAAVAADMAAVLDQLGIERCLVSGASGGGPHALATAALLPERVTAVASIAGVGPYARPGLDFLAGMGQDNLDEFGAALAGPEQLRLFLERARPELVQVTPDQIIAALDSLLPPPDRAVLSAELGLDLVASFTHALIPGVDGWLADDLAFIHPWGFEPDDLKTPVTVWQGGLDLMVPSAHGVWLAEHLPRARARLLPDEGHLSIAVGHMDEILSDLLGHVTD